MNSPVNVENGTTSVVTVLFTNDDKTPVNNLGFDLQFDNNVIEYVGYNMSIVAGVPRSNSIDVNLLDPATCRTGWFSSAGDGASNITPGTSSLAQITFRAVRPMSISRLHFTGINFFDMDGNPVTVTAVDGTFSTAGPASSGAIPSAPVSGAPPEVSPAAGVPDRTETPVPNPTRTPPDIMVVTGALAIGVAVFARARR